MSFHPNPTSDQERRENWRTAREILDEEYFNVTLTAGDGVPGLVAGTAVNAVFDPQAITNKPSVEFPATAGGKPAWRTIKRRKTRWRRCGVRLTIVYAGTVGSANDVVLQVVVRNFSAGDGASGDTVLATLTVPGPAVAQTFYEYVYVNTATTVVPGHKDWVSFWILRDKTNAADTNANSLYVQALRFELLPA